MATRRALAGVAHDIAHHAGSSVGWLSPHMAIALRGVGVDSTIVELLEASPYPPRALEVKPLQLALAALRVTAEAILHKYGFSFADVTSIKLHATPAPWDHSDYLLHTRVILTGTDGKHYDSGWLQ